MKVQVWDKEQQRLVYVRRVDANKHVQVDLSQLPANYDPKYLTCDLNTGIVSVCTPDQIVLRNKKYLDNIKKTYIKVIRKEETRKLEAAGILVDDFLRWQTLYAAKDVLKYPFNVVYDDDTTITVADSVMLSQVYQNLQQQFRAILQESSNIIKALSKASTKEEVQQVIGNYTVLNASRN